MSLPAFAVPSCVLLAVLLALSGCQYIKSSDDLSHEFVASQPKPVTVTTQPAGDPGKIVNTEFPSSGRQPVRLAPEANPVPAPYPNNVPTPGEY